MGDHNGKQGNIPDFEIVLWGYDRGQVERCLDDLSARLEEAFCRLDSVEVLQAELCEAQLEVDQLRRCAEERPSVANRLAKLLQTAEELHTRARQDAAAIRAGGSGVARSRNGSGPGSVQVSGQ
ncbi:MAG: hypothetical protein ACRDT2_08640 [Natronosporangium sp.]